MRITALILGSLAAYGIVACGEDDVGALLTDTTNWPVKKDGGVPAADASAPAEELPPTGTIIEAGAGDAGPDVEEPADVTAPVVAIVSPREGIAIDERHVIVDGTATDNVGLTSLTWSTGGDATTITPAADGSFHFDFVPTPGTSTITLVARDAAGNETKATRSAYFGHRISVGNSQSAMLAGGKLYTWGRNELGQLANGTLVGTWSASDDVNPPAMYEQDAPSLVSIVTRQTFMIALANDGTVQTWGANGDGQLGYATPANCGTNGTTACGRTRANVPGITNAVAVAAGFTHSLVLLADGTVMAWGANDKGQLGIAGVTATSTPTLVTGLTNIVALGAGSAHSLAVTADGKVFTWGSNQYGLLGDGTTDTASHPVPTEVPGLTGVASVAGANYTTYARKTDGTLVAWGQNANGQVGNGTTTLVTQPTPVLLSVKTDVAEAVPLANVDSISADGFVGLALTRDGSAYAWGLGSLGQLGQGYLADGTTRDLANRSVASKIVVEAAVEVETGAGGPGFALTPAGQLFGWGWSFQGSLGGGKTLIDAWAYSAPRLVFPLL